jgi:hypothetical protein
LAKGHVSVFKSFNLLQTFAAEGAAHKPVSHLGRIKKSTVIIVPDYYRIEAFSGLYPPMTNTWLLFSLHFNHAPVLANENIGKEDGSMSLNQPLIWRNPIWKEVASQLAHVESELCWCDPIVEIDEYGQQVVMHKEVTWH